MLSERCFPFRRSACLSHLVDIRMTEQTKAAIERACEMQGYRADWYFKGGYYDEVQIAQIETVARHLDQVSETAKANEEVFEAKAVPTYIDGPRWNNKTLILRDPEPDAIEIALAEALKGKEFQSEYGRIAWSNGFREALRHAITKTGEAGQ